MEKTNNIKNYEDYIGKKVIGFKFDTRVTCGYSPLMEDYIGDVGTIVEWVSGLDVFEVEFEDGANWYYPADLVIKQLEQKEIYDEDPYSWVNNGIREAESRKEVNINTQPHYDNTHGSLYKIAEQRGWNSYQFDICKRIDRALKKGQFEEDLKKTKDLIDLWLREFKDEN